MVPLITEISNQKLKFNIVTRKKKKKNKYLDVIFTQWFMHGFVECHIVAI